MNYQDATKVRNKDQQMVPRPTPRNSYMQAVGHVSGINAQVIHGHVMYKEESTYNPQDNRAMYTSDPLLCWDTLMAGLSNMTEESGKCFIGGRLIRYHVVGRLQGFKWVYDAKIMDLETQIRGTSRHYKSRNGALGHALTDLGGQLKEQGILQD